MIERNSNSNNKDQIYYHIMKTMMRCTTYQNLGLIQRWTLVIWLSKHHPSLSFLSNLSLTSPNPEPRNPNLKTLNLKPETPKPLNPKL